MATTVITNIASLVTNDPALGDGSPLGLIQDAAVVVDADRIAWVGPADKAPAADGTYDADGRAVIPGFVDSHSHLVFAGDRTAEFNARMSGRSYSMRRHPDHRRRHPRRHRRRARSQPGAPPGRGPPPGHHHLRDQVGLRPHHRRRGPRPAHRRRAHRRGHLPRRAHRLPGLRRGPGRLRGPRHRRDAGRLRPVRPLGGRLLREGRLRRGPGPRDPHRGQPAPG